MSTQRKNDLLRQGSILAVAGILVRLIGILYRIPMSNLLGDVGNGIYSVAYGIYSVTLTLSSSSPAAGGVQTDCPAFYSKAASECFTVFSASRLFFL